MLQTYEYVIMFISDFFGPNVALILRANTAHHDIALLNFTIKYHLLWSLFVGVDVVIVAPVGLGWTN